MMQFNEAPPARHKCGSPVLSLASQRQVGNVLLEGFLRLPGQVYPRFFHQVGAILSGIRGDILHFEDGLIMIDDEVVKTLLINLDIIFAGKSIAETGEGHCLPSPERVVPKCAVTLS